MGGKKKKSSKVAVKKESKFKIPTVFDCPLCDGKSCIVIKMYRSAHKATARCRLCNCPNPPYDYTLKPLDKQVDVFFAFYEDCRLRDLQGQRTAMSAAPEMEGGKSDGILHELDILGNVGSGASPNAAEDEDDAEVAALDEDSTPSENQDAVAL